MFVIFDITHLVNYIREVYISSKSIADYNNPLVISKNERSFREFLLFSLKFFFKKKGFNVKDYRIDSAFEYIYFQLSTESPTSLDALYDTFFTNTPNSMFNMNYINNQFKNTNSILSIMVVNHTLIIGEEIYNWH